MIQSTLSNMAVILLSHLLVTTMLSYKERFTNLTQRISIIVLASVTIISMYYLPIYFEDYRSDLRLIPLIMLAIFSGTRITIPVLIIASIWWLVIGGDGTILGVVFGMALPTLYALLYVKVIGRSFKFWEIVFLISTCWVLSDVPLIFYMPNGFDVLKQLCVWRYPTFLIAACIYYMVIQIDNKRLKMKDELQFMAIHDQLTKLLNKQEFIRRAELKRKMIGREKLHFIGMIDFDHFKRFNDEYGHIAGDEVLVQMATIFKSVENEYTFIARYGGEEFILYINAVNPDQAVNKIKVLQEKIRRTSFQIEPNTEISITVSIGLAKWEDGDTIQDVIREADQNLYVAKERGRDQLV